MSVLLLLNGCVAIAGDCVLQLNGCAQWLVAVCCSIAVCQDKLPSCSLVSRYTFGTCHKGLCYNFGNKVSHCVCRRGGGGVCVRVVLLVV